MKKIIIFLLSILLVSCKETGSDNERLDSTNKEEMELKRKGLDLKKKELELKEKENALLSDKNKELESNLRENDLKSTNENSNQTKPEQQKTKKYIAIIQDPDGYTNVRNGMSTNALIIDKLFEGEHYEVFPSSDSNWWMVLTQTKVKGYVHKSRIKIIN